jgi:hypothetical protein
MHCGGRICIVVVEYALWWSNMHCGGRRCVLHILTDSKSATCAGLMWKVKQSIVQCNVVAEVAMFSVMYQLRLQCSVLCTS